MKLPEENTRKIAVLRALQLGDLLCAIPAIRALRHAYPKAQIALLGLPWASSFTGRFSMYFDSFIHFPGYEGLPEQPYDAQAWAAFLQQVKNERFDLILQMQGNGTIVNQLVQQWGAAHTAGFYPAGSHDSSLLYMPYPDMAPEPERHLMLMQHLGITPMGIHLEFPITENDKKELMDLQLPLQPGRYVCVHPGSRGAWRQWPPRYFAALADYCAARGLTVVVTGTGEEAGIVTEMIKWMKQPAINLAGKTSLGAVGWLIKEACLLIANCTGVSHIAAATRTPSVIISMDGEPNRWAPSDSSLHTVIDGSKHHQFEKMLLETTARLQSVGTTPV